MGFSTDESVVRVDFFRKSGKWYCTEAVKFLYYFSSGSEHVREGEIGMDVRSAFLAALKEHLKDDRLKGMTAVCLEPYHEHAHPLMVTVPE